MKDVFQIILELTQRKIRCGIRILAIMPHEKNNQPCQNYSLRESQVNRDTLWTDITTKRQIY